MILFTIDFSKAFESVWHPTLFHKLLSAGLPPCFARWIQPFLSDRHLAWFIKITKVVPFESLEVFCKDPFSSLYFSIFSSMIFLLLCLLRSATLYADNLSVWSFSPSVPTAVEATQGALFQLERWSEYRCAFLNPSESEVSFFSVDPHQANLQPNLLLLNSRRRCNPIPTLRRITFDRILSFSKHVAALKAKFFLCLKVLRCISTSSRGPLRIPSFFCIKFFFDPFLYMLSPDVFF